MINNKKIFIIGGSGSLGNQLISKYIADNIVICYSRDECKHWAMELKYKSKNLKFIIGDIRDYSRIETSILSENPDIIIIAAALKHVDRCEYATHECLHTNLIGTKNVVDCVEKNIDRLPNLETICFISTDKSCEPANVYGFCKALSETLMIEKAYYIKNKKFVCVRYGNVLNSRGSIIPILHEKGKDESVTAYTLTHTDMTRFIMTLEDSVNLIEHAILHAESGDIVIPTLSAMKLIDLFNIFSEKYNKPIKITTLRPGEKMAEALISETQSMRLVDDGKYMYIKPSYHNKIYSTDLKNYNSNQNLLTKEELKDYLTKIDLL